MTAAARPALTQGRLKELLHYDPETGVFTRLTSHKGKGFVAGVRAGTLKKHGYRTIDIDGTRYYEHHLAWFYVTGEWPADGVLIDHRDRPRDCNAFSNLRKASPEQNTYNRKINKTSQTGFKGVVKHCNEKRSKRYGARIKQNYKSIHIGWFATPEEAHAAYAAKAKELFGEFARAA